TNVLRHSHARAPIVVLGGCVDPGCQLHPLGAPETTPPFSGSSAGVSHRATTRRYGTASSDSTRSPQKRTSPDGASRPPRVHRTACPPSPRRTKLGRCRPDRTHGAENQPARATRCAHSSPP